MNSLLMFVPLLIQLSDKEKKTVGIIAAIILCVLLLLGLIARLLLSIKDKKGREIDTYMYDFVRYGIIKNPGEFRRYVLKRESIQLYLKTRVFIRIFILMCIGVIIYANTTLKGDYSSIWTVFHDFFPKWEFPKTELFGIKLIADWPQLVKKPEIHLDVTGYITYIAMLISLITGIKLICSSFVYYARLDRSSKASVKAFNKNLDNGVGGEKHGFE